MQQYLDLVRDILDHGVWQENRTGTRTLSRAGAMLRFDLQQGFPAVTTKKLAFKSAIGELVGFLRASRSAAEFRALGCKVWDQNANENKQWLANPYRLGADDLGPVYGVQWRQWPAYKLLDLSNPGQIDDAVARGYSRIAAFDDDGTRKVLLYKAVDQLRQCLDIGRRSKKWHCRLATFFTNSCRRQRRARSRCACTFAVTTLASARRLI
jgi:thymidylate synthase